MLANKLLLADTETPLPGRDQAMLLENRHYLTGRPIMPPFSECGEEYQQVLFGLGFFGVPSSITSNIWPQTQMAIVGSAVAGSPARFESA